MADPILISNLPNAAPELAGKVIHNTVAGVTSKCPIADVLALQTDASTGGKGMVELATTAEVITGTSTTLVPSVAAMVAGTIHRVRGHVSNPQVVYAQQAQLFIMRAEANLTITRIHIHLNCDPTTEMAGDLKWADDLITGTYANATVIDICDTTAGIFTVTAGMDDPTVASGKYIYYQWDASPHADIKSIYFEMYYTLD